MNKIRYFAVFHWAKIFCKQTFPFPTQKIQKLSASVIERKKRDVDRLDGEQSRTSSTFLTGMEFINFFEGVVERLLTNFHTNQEFYEFIDIELMHC